MSKGLGGRKGLINTGELGTDDNSTMTKEMLEKAKAMFEKGSQDIIIQSEEIKQDNSQDKFTEGAVVVNIPLERLIPSPANIFDAWDDETMLINKISILNNGLFSPIIVKDNADSTYTILAGHNRTEAYKQIVNEAKELGKNGIAKRFSAIPAFIKDSMLTEEECLEIIVDTNIKARKKLSKESELKVMAASVSIMKRQKGLTGVNLLEILEGNNIKKTTAYDADKLIRDAIPEVLNLYYSGTLHKKSVLTLSSLKKNVQKYLVSQYKDKLNNVIVKSIPNNSTKEDIDNIFSVSDNDVMVIKNKRFIIKENEEELFERWLKTWEEFKGAHI